MSLIDRSYFTVELDIARTNTTAVQEVLDALIQKKETELLKSLLGYALYKAFMAGLLIDPLPTIWSRLLLGGEYTDRFGQLQYWRGLVSVPPVLVNAVTAANRISYVVLQSDVDNQTIPVPVSMVGRPWAIDKRVIGPLRPDEFDVSDDGTTVAFTAAVVLGDTYTFLSNDLSLEESAPGDKYSLIANYVYFHYRFNNASVTVSLGEASPKAENSTKQGPSAKQQRAWGEMVDQIYELVEFLDRNKDDYPDWKLNQRYFVFSNYKYITRF